jgi:hypothetical protein
MAIDSHTTREQHVRDAWGLIQETAAGLLGGDPV